ncbi:MAG: T9SS type A sorting domain-containing protein [Saprospiraceae bacterium]|nr:T9SS type A sorting domain-containing protein [Saprospiraceae bacterium]
MKIHPLLAFFIYLFLFGMTAHAQERSCIYRLELYDSFGDGWNNAFLTLIMNGDTTTFTLDGENDNGFFRAFPVEVTHGDTARFFFTAGGFDGELSYAIFNPENIRVFANGPSPVANFIFTAVVECPSCLVSPPNTIAIDDVRAFTAKVSWRAIEDAEFYLVEYGIKGFTPGAGSITKSNVNTATLRDLMENRDYEFYLSSVCNGPDTSRQIGPFAFKTLWANNVGIIAIGTPETQCGLGAAEKVTVTLKNFGGNPQSLIPFKYSVNGVDAGVPIPVDGFFTGVLGKDSTFTVEFETTFDFSEPGEYIIQAWTELEEESETMNDTMTVSITSIPIITQYPYQTDFEDWGSGWTVSSESRNPSWTYGIPASTLLNSAASGQYAWVTNLDSTYNNSELSYLLSPCLDFSNLTIDPRMTFSLYFDSEACCDKGWLEKSIDDGRTWTKVGTTGNGINWYNDTTNVWWDGTGGFSGWVTASNILAGTAGQAAVRLRFVFSSDVSVARKGMAIDDIFISAPLARDLATLTATHDNEEECGSADDQISVTITNFGSSTVSGFDVSYQVNDGPIVTENVDTLSLSPGEQATYTFDTPVNTVDGITFDVMVWIDDPTDLLAANDSTTFSFATARSLPFGEDFEGQALPTGWMVDNLTAVLNTHGNSSYVVSDNLSNTDRVMEVTTPALGVVEAGDSLTFDYRIVNFNGNGATQLGTADSIIVQISLDCGGSYSTIYKIAQNNHISDTSLQKVTIFLDNYIGEVVKFRIRAFWGAGDYWVDFDNFNIIRCPASLGLMTQVQDESNAGANDGLATVIVAAGAEPFSYIWSNGGTTKTVDKLDAGTYIVTVTDRFGCSDVAVAAVNTLTDIGAPEIITLVSLAPNPTSGETLLKVNLSETADLQVQVFNLQGQLIFQALERNAIHLNMPIDLRSQPSGLYLIRLIANEQTRTEKLIKSR